MRYKLATFICILCFTCNLSLASISSEDPSDIIDEIPPKIHTRWTSYVNSNYILDMEVDGNFLWIVGGGVKRYNLTNGKYTFYYTEHGLASNDTRSIAVDKRHVWVATAMGVSRFDKKEKTWKNFFPAEGLAEEVVVSVEVDRARRCVWFGTWESGISRFDMERESWKTFDPNPRRDIDTVISIAVDEEEDAVWFGTWDDGLVKLDLKTCNRHTWDEKNGLPQNAVTSIAVEGDVVWVGTMTSGLCQYNKRKNTWKYFTKSDGLTGDWISSILVDPLRERVWIATQDGGVCQFRKDTKRWESLRLPDPAVKETTSLALHNDILFIGTHGDGFWQYNLCLQKGEHFSTPVTISHNRVVCIVPDKKGDTIWFGTEGGGASSYDLIHNNWKQYAVKNGLLPNNIVNEIVVDDGEQLVWFGTDDGLIAYRFKPELKKIRRALEGKLIYSLCPTRKSFFAGAYLEGLYYFDRSTETWHEFPALQEYTFHALVVDEQEGKLWGGTNLGLVVFDRKTSRQIFPRDGNDIPHASSRNIGIDRTRRIAWAGTWGAGILKLDYHSGKWNILTTENGLPSNYAIDIDNTRKDVLWVATDRGVARYDLKSDVWQTFTNHDGLAHILTLTLAVHEDSLWIGTWGGGVSRYRLEE